MFLKKLLESGTVPLLPKLSKKILSLFDFMYCHSPIYEHFGSYYYAVLPRRPH